jgi:hypothetical protein
MIELKSIKTEMERHLKSMNNGLLYELEIKENNMNDKELYTVDSAKNPYDLTPKEREQYNKIKESGRTDLMFEFAYLIGWQHKAKQMVSEFKRVNGIK